MLDSLAEDMRSGEAVFEVKLIKGDGDRYSRTVATCWARVGGGLDDRTSDGGKEVEYSVAINAVHGLYPATELSTEYALNPEFDLTVRVSAYSRLAGAECIEPGTTVEVSYHGVLLASAPVDKFCAGVKETREQHVVAWGTGVHLPRFAVDALVEDARRGAEAFDVAVKMTTQKGLVVGTLITCKERRVGDAAASPRIPCDVSAMAIPVRPVQSPNTGKTLTGEHELPVHWAVAEPDNTQRRGVLGGVRLRIDTVCLVMVCMILIAVAFLAMMIVAIVKDWTQPASYSVAIDSVAGLDPETDLPRDTLNPEFNLTLRLASQRADMGVCFKAGTTVVVYYGGVQLAGAAVPALCAGPRPSAEEESVVAWGRGVPVPRLARDRLAGDLRGGAAEFDVTLTVQRYTYAESWDVVLCSGKVGDAAALITPCSLYDENVQEPSLEPGYGGYSSQPESPPEAGDDDQDQIRRLLRCSSGIAIAVLVVVGVLVLCALEASKAPRLSVAVATVSGLDPATDLARPAVDPQFNLTLRVASRSLLSRACVGVSSTAVAVSYHGVRLASAPVAPRVCAARRKSADAGPFVAWGAPRLAADMRNGAAAFDVTLMDGHLVVCRGRRVGDADALRAPCVLTHVETGAAVPHTGTLQHIPFLRLQMLPICQINVYKNPGRRTPALSIKNARTKRIEYKQRLKINVQ
uniref:Late embryogenesis abundant protein LEA-2 subgroup domain-containing protein n=1 Tax=Oryza glumipatula TaxID=40148 RepID=A0A0D9YV24_9ORYZ